MPWPVAALFEVRSQKAKVKGQKLKVKGQKSGREIRVFSG